MEHLDEERSQTADEHGRQVTVDDPRDAVEGEVGLVWIVAAWGRGIRQSDGLADVAIDAPLESRQDLTGHRGVHLSSLIPTPRLGRSLSFHSPVWDT
jgi:hypothetical protein